MIILQEDDVYNGYNGGPDGRRAAPLVPAVQAHVPVNDDMIMIIIIRLYGNVQIDMMMMIIIIGCMSIVIDR
jgi:hypothetical protein